MIRWKTYFTEMAPSDQKPVYPIRLRAGFQSIPIFNSFKI